MTRLASSWRRWVAGATTCALAMAIAGCVSYHPEPLSPQRSLDALRVRSLSDPAVIAYVTGHLPPDVEPPPVWTFDALAWAAYRLNPDLASARAKLGVAQAGEVVAAEHPNPSLSLPFEYTANPKPGELPYTFGLGLDIPIEVAGKRDARMAFASQVTRAAAFELGAAAWQVRSRLRTAMLDLRHARAVEALTAAQAAHQSQIVNLLAQRFALGETARLELVQAQSELAQTQQRQAKLRQSVVQAQAHIAEAVGVPLAAVAQADLRLDTLEQAPMAVPDGQALDDALENRADVQAALADYDASQAALRLAVASQYPDIHLGPGYTFDAGAHKYALSLSGLELPLFNRHQGEIAQAEARRKQAAARFEAVMVHSVSQVDQALAALHEARNEFAVAEQRQSDQARLTTGDRQSFELGNISRLDWVEASLHADTAALQHEDARDHLLRAAAALEDSVQRPLNGAHAPTGQEP